MRWGLREGSSLNSPEFSVLMNQRLNSGVFSYGVGCDASAWSANDSRMRASR